MTTTLYLTYNLTLTNGLKTINELGAPLCYNVQTVTIQLQLFSLLEKKISLNKLFFFFAGRTLPQ